MDTIEDSGLIRGQDRRQDGYPEIHQGGKKAKDAKLLYPNLDDPEHAKQRLERHLLMRADG